MYLDMVLIHICCKIRAACQLQVKGVLSYGKLMKVMLGFDGCCFCGSLGLTIVIKAIGMFFSRQAFFQADKQCSSLHPEEEFNPKVKFA